VNDGNARVLRPGHRIALGQDLYTIIQLNGTTVTLQDQRGELSAMLLGYLFTARQQTAPDVACAATVPMLTRACSCTRQHACAMDTGSTVKAEGSSWTRPPSPTLPLPSAASIG
jgi:hypothetical protein